VPPLNRARETRHISNSFLDIGWFSRFEGLAQSLETGYFPA